ncbi:MAG: tyrosine--tRNA ligase [Bacteroidales bacterium]|nr:tyrosine--tRNA ligase [Bacteroidales bacterium]
MKFVEELRWRGMIHDIMPGTEELLDKEMVSGYIGFDPSADSLHIGNLAGIMLLKQLQLGGHKPIVLVGGATGMIGDPSGKSQERNLLDEKTLRHNQECIKKQLSHFLDFDSDKPNEAIMVNNYDWMKEFSFLDFIRDIGKHITVNYMMAKDSVKSRIGSESNEGMSFTEFSYQLVQGTDFLHLYKANNCKLQMGGSDQWGNIVTGTELIRRKTGGEAFSLTCPLVTKSDGSKFGKSESGNVWLDSKKTSPYSFYQFWLNVSDEDAEKYIKIFTTLSKSEVDSLVKEHQEAPHVRLLQKKLAREVTILTHGEEELDAAIEASSILFGKGTTDTLKRMDENTFLSVFEGVPQFKLREIVIKSGESLMNLLTKETSVFTSKSELRRLVSGGGLSINKGKISDLDKIVDESFLLNERYILVQKGKKNYFLLVVEKTN